MWRNLGQIPPHREGHIGVPHRTGATSGVPHRGATSGGCHTGGATSEKNRRCFKKMPSQLDICEILSVLPMQMHTPPTAPRPSESTERLEAGGGAREPQKQAFAASVEEPGLELGEAETKMPPKKLQRDSKNH